MCAEKCEKKCERCAAREERASKLVDRSAPPKDRRERP